MNDPATSLTSGSVRTIDEIPEDVEVDENFDWEEWYAGFPDTIEGFKESPLLQTIYSQIAARLSPNPDSPLLGDLPFNELGEFEPEARELWRDFDLLDPNSIELHRDALEALSTVTVTLPSESKGMPWNRELVQVLEAAGIRAQGIVVEGEHNERWYERFTKLLSNVTYGMRGTSALSIGEDTYTQDFDTLGLNDTDGVSLPSGWSVTDGHRYVFRDHTNTGFAGGKVELIGQQPYILNVGGEQDADRSLAVSIPSESTGTTIQFLADVTSVEANAFQLAFDIEAWDQLGEAVGRG